MFRPPIRTLYHQLSDYEVGDVVYYTRSDINDSDYGIIIDIDDSEIHIDGPMVFRSPVGPYRKSFDFIYNDGNFYDKDYEITIQNLGPPEITPEEPWDCNAVLRTLDIRYANGIGNSSNHYRTIRFDRNLQSTT